MTIPLHSVLLSISLLAVWAPARWGVAAWIPCYVAAVVAAWVSGAIHPLALLSLAALGAMAYQYLHCRNIRHRRLWGVALLCTAVSMGFQLLPGFEYILVADQVQLSPDTEVFHVTLHFYQGTAALFILIAFAPRAAASRLITDALRPSIAVALMTIAGVIGLACAMGYIRFDPKLPNSTVAIAFTLHMLLWTAVLEECLFRVLLQGYLSSLRMFQRWPYAPVLIVACVFGLAHDAHFGPYFWLASSAGFGYGVAYYKCRTVEAPVFVHFTLNMVHFLLFSYPRLIPVH